ncbi:phosphatase PAP2 family protein [Avibacterium paragallinarum]|uniref:undecaprenyl-diphosphate phosphatase n=1 Tax=Avibacterium paragallinarum TaxID=728 RepID=A0A377IBH1_AVIPA|nr:phosphatase PAP2 family protein [Avibacterium paragallinarum]POY47059.1 phosphatase PAP2 family protein [Avibacterium paragallinarum]RZN74023.1 phosphatase PAP2 family protein [Avibacterium paragallinarum]CDF98851.1 Putative PgpB protein [Avibacterium paragallinarum JF4211]STO72099.1 phosphatidylglycerophosphatase [Avibacterium paragallinarum]
MLKRLSLYTLLLCCVPFFAWLINWHWQGDTNYTQIDTLLYFITETGSSPYAILTCAFFALVYFFAIRNKKQALAVIAVMAISVGVTQGVKSVLKTVFAEPRPFIVQLGEKSSVSPDYFYGQPRKVREQIVLDYYADKQIDMHLVHHRSKETGYSFPSGHSIFAATWLMLAVGFGQLLGRNNKGMKYLTAGIAVWAVLILVSRLRLGMHYPVDLLASVLIAWLFHCVLFVLLPRWRIFQPKNQ